MAIKNIFGKFGKKKNTDTALMTSIPSLALNTITTFQTTFPENRPKLPPARLVTPATPEKFPTIKETPTVIASTGFIDNAITNTTIHNTAATHNGMSAFARMVARRQRRVSSRGRTGDPDIVAAAIPAGSPPMPPAPPAKVDDRLHEHYEKTKKLVAIALEKPILRHEFVSFADGVNNTRDEVAFDFELMNEHWAKLKKIVVLYAKFDPDMSMFAHMYKLFNNDTMNFTDRMFKIRDELYYQAPVSGWDACKLHRAISDLVYSKYGCTYLLNILSYLSKKCQKVIANPPRPSEVRRLSLEFNYASKHGCDTQAEFNQLVTDLTEELAKLPESQRARFTLEREYVDPENGSYNAEEVQKMKKWWDTPAGCFILLNFGGKKIPFDILEKANRGELKTKPEYVNNGEAEDEGKNQAYALARLEGIL